MVHKKRGYFFIIDAVLALIIIVIGVFLINSSYVKIPQTTQVGLLSDDLISFLSNTKLKNLNNEYAGFGGELWNQKLIHDSDNSLLQQIGEFYATKNFDIAEKFIQNVSRDVIPSQFEYEVLINGQLLYPRNPTIQHNISKQNTKIMLTSKLLTFGIVNATSSEIWGPYKAEVFVWER